MDFFTAFNISASGLSAQRIRMNTISSNLANAYSTQTPEGGPYRRKDVVFSATPVKKTFQDVLHTEMQGKINQVGVVEIIEDPRPFKTVYDPYHPDADKLGFVSYPNVNVMEEMVNMLSASRSYEANISAIKAAQNMALKALEIAR